MVKHITSDQVSIIGVDRVANAALSVTRAFQCQALHAGVLSFVHSVTGEALRFGAPVPPNMAGLIRALNDLPKDA